MKKHIILLAVLSLATLFSCQKENENKEDINPEVKTDIHTLTVAFPSMTDQKGTKVSLSTTGKTQWEVGDKLLIYGKPSNYIVHEIVAADITDPEIAVFDVDFSGLVEDTSDTNRHAYTAIYPYTPGARFYSSSSSNYGRSRFQNTNQLLMAGYVSDDKSSIVLNPLTAAITFSISGDYDSYVFSGRSGDEVVGYSDLMVEMNRKEGSEGMYRQKFSTANTDGTYGPQTSITGAVNGDGTTVNHVFLPVNALMEGTSPNYTYDITSGRYANVAYLPNGFTIKFLKGENIVNYVSSSAPLIIRPGHMIDLGVIPAGAIRNVHKTDMVEDISTVTDLSASATANCYIVDGSVAANADAFFKFKAAKGKGGDVLTKIGGDEDKDVVVLWETKNTDVAPTKGDIIAAVDYDNRDGGDTYIVFKMPTTITPGNALIAAKNAAGEILWSWHIWVTKTSITTDTYGLYPSPMMDRNLGALEAASATPSVESIGLLYQWGRKDPFTGARSFNTTEAASYYHPEGVSISNRKAQMSVAESILNPTVFARPTDQTTKDWNSTSDGELWGYTSGKKSVYDPCPPGYKVPQREGTLYTANLVDLGTDNFTYDGTNYYVKVRGSVNDNFTYFPIAGYRDTNSYICHVYDRILVWTNRGHSTDVYKAYPQYIYDENGITSATWSNEKSKGASIRCVAE